MTKHSAEITANILKKAIETKGAVYTDNTNGVQTSQIVRSHGWADVIEGIPSRGTE